MTGQAIVLLCQRLQLSSIGSEETRKFGPLSWKKHVQGEFLLNLGNFSVPVQSADTNVMRFF